MLESEHNQPMSAQRQGALALTFATLLSTLFVPKFSHAASPQTIFLSPAASYHRLFRCHPKLRLCRLRQDRLNRFFVCRITDADPGTLFLPGAYAASTHRQLTIFGNPT